MGIFKNMKAVLGYYYPAGEWQIIDIIAGPLSSGADVYKRCQVGECFTEFVEAPILTINNDGVEIDEDFIFPEVMTLENSIQKNIETLRNWSNNPELCCASAASI